MGIKQMFRQTVVLETYLGSSSYGEDFASAVTVPCFISDGERIVRSTTNEQVVSSTTLYADVTTAPTDPPVAGQFEPNSRVTVNGRQARVIETLRMDQAGPARIHHAAVHLT